MPTATIAFDADGLLTVRETGFFDANMVKLRNGGWKLEGMQWADPSPRLELAVRAVKPLLRDCLPAMVNADDPVIVLEKTSVMHLSGGEVMLGLGWDPLPGAQVADLDAGCVLLDKDNVYVDFCYFHNLAVPGVQHSGDNRTGEGDGDDETIRFQLGEVPPNVESIVVAISCFAGDLARVQNAHCRVYDFATGSDLCTFSLGGRYAETSLLVCKLYRDAHAGGFWKLQVIGTPINGRNIVEFFFQDTHGPMADLRNEFKVKAACPYNDSKFFAAIEAMREAGVEAARTDKDPHH